MIFCCYQINLIAQYASAQKEWEFIYQKELLELLENEATDDGLFFVLSTVYGIRSHMLLLPLSTFVYVKWVRSD